MESDRIRIAVILGSTRPNRVGEGVARWAHETASRRGDAQYDFIDVGELGLPFLDEPQPPSRGQYSKQHTKDWSAKVASYDGFVFVTPEYNHGIPAALKNAIDFLYAEWNDKAAGFVSYGGTGGVRAVESLRLVMGEIMVADVRSQVPLTLANDFENYTVFKPTEKHEKWLNTMLDQLVAWSGALKGVRQAKAQAVASAARRESSATAA